MCFTVSEFFFFTHIVDTLKILAETSLQHILSKSYMNCYFYMWFGYPECVFQLYIMYLL